MNAKRFAVLCLIALAACREGKKEDASLSDVIVQSPQDSICEFIDQQGLWPSQLLGWNYGISDFWKAETEGKTDPAQGELASLPNRAPDTTLHVVPSEGYEYDLDIWHEGKETWFREGFPFPIVYHMTSKGEFADFNIIYQTEQVCLISHCSLTDLDTEGQGLFAKHTFWPMVDGIQTESRIVRIGLTVKDLQNYPSIDAAMRDPEDVRDILQALRRKGVFTLGSGTSFAKLESDFGTVAGVSIHDWRIYTVKSVKELNDAHLEEMIFTTARGDSNFYRIRSLWTTGESPKRVAQSLDIFQNSSDFPHAGLGYLYGGEEDLKAIFSLNVSTGYTVAIRDPGRCNAQGS